MENKLEIFKNQEFGDIRTVEENGKILFCGSDIAKALGYAKPNNAIKSHCKGTTLKQGIVTKQGNISDMLFVTEGDVYRLITHSKLPSAEKFEKWVFDEVLPTIRNHGAYLTNMKIEEILNNPDTIIKLATDLKNEREEKEKLQLENMQQQQIIGELKPKADYTDTILQNKSLVTITAIAKDYGMGAKTMNQKLHDLGIQYKQSGQWFLYEKYHDKGYTHSETIDLKHKDGNEFVKMNTKWTQKGRLFLYELLKKNGILPMIERKS